MQENIKEGNNVKENHRVLNRRRHDELLFRGCDSGTGNAGIQVDVF